jgi:hypothetical protein
MRAPLRLDRFSPYSPVPASVEKEDFLAVFYIYADESGKPQKDDYTSLCGYVAHEAEWARFLLEWQAVRMKWQIPPVHMARIMFPERKDDEWLKVRKAWGKDWEFKRDMMLQELAMTVRGAALVAIGAVVDAKHFRALADSEFKREAKDPLFLALHTVVMRAIEATEVIDRCSPIGLIIDDDRENSIECYRRLNNLKDHPHLMFAKVRERIRSMTFANDDYYPGLQAADMLAYESRRYMVSRIDNPEAEPSELLMLLTTLFIHQPRLYTPAILDQLEKGTLKMLEDERAKEKDDKQESGV